MCHTHIHADKERGETMASKRGRKFLIIEDEKVIRVPNLKHMEELFIKGVAEQSECS